MRIRIEIEDKGLKSSHEFESQNMDGEALRDRIIGFLSASGIFESRGESIASNTSAHDYSSGTLMDRLESFIPLISPVLNNFFMTFSELKI